MTNKLNYLSPNALTNHEGSTTFMALTVRLYIVNQSDVHYPYENDDTTVFLTTTLTLPIYKDPVGEWMTKFLLNNDLVLFIHVSVYYLQWLITLPWQRAHIIFMEH